MTTAEQLTVPEIKQCSACKFFLPVMEFYWVNKAGEGLRRGQCKACMKTLKAAQRDPDWRPSCSRCGGLMSARTGPGRRLCDTCFGETYDVVGQRDNGAHRIRLKPCSLRGGPKERFERKRFCRTCKPWESYASNLRRFGLAPAEYVAILMRRGAPATSAGLGLRTRGSALIMITQCLRVAHRCAGCCVASATTIACPGSLRTLPCSSAPWLT